MTYTVLKKCAFGLFLLAVLSKSLSAESDGTSSSRARTWFEWGEYARILDSVPAYLDKVPDSLKKAELKKYLAVARFASGYLGPARETFIQALKLNRNIELDEEFVSEEMLDLFTSTRDEYLKSLKEQAIQDSILLQSRQEVIRRDNVLDSIARVERKVRKRRSITAAVTAGALTALFLAGAIYEYSLAEEAYADYSEARIAGDKTGYEAAKEQTEYHDGLYVGSAALSILSAGVTTLFSVAAHRAGGEEGTSNFRVPVMEKAGQAYGSDLDEAMPTDEAPLDGEER